MKQRTTRATSTAWASGFKVLTVNWFFDSALVRKTSNAKCVPGRVKKHAGNPLFLEGAHSAPCLPWEVRIDNGYPNVIYDARAGKYRCYYTCFVHDEVSERTPRAQRPGKTYQPTASRMAALLYAESSDGLHWVRPALGITPYGGTRENNILLLRVSGASVLLDEAEEDPAKRYKLIGRDDGAGGGLCVAFSADGLHFTEPVHVAADVPGDTHNFALRCPETGEYRLCTRLFSRGLRTVAHMRSGDFLHWSPPQQVMAGSGADDQLYAMPVFEQDGLYFGLAAVFHAGDDTLAHHDHVEVELCYSGDGVRWQRVAPGEAFIPNGPGAYGSGACDAGCCFASVPVAQGDELRFYYMGGNGTHYGFRETGLCLASIAKRKLAGLAARDAAKPFAVQTIRLRLAGNRLLLTADVEAGGSIRYALLTPQGEALTGFTQENCRTITASGEELPLTWETQEAWPQECVLALTCERAVLYGLSGDYVLCPAHPL